MKYQTLLRHQEQIWRLYWKFSRLRKAIMTLSNPRKKGLKF